MAKIIGVQKRGLADKAGIKKGDELVAINHKPLIDILDLAYAEGQDRCVLTVMRDGKNIDFTIKKKYFDDEIGIDVGDSLEINCPINCHNNCVFCFVAQLPKGMRNTLYVKDDDYRLSFASGSYITCTNLKDSEIERIIEYKLSPLYISVHATDEETRLKLLGVKRSRNQLELIKKFADNGIKMHTQIVLVPEWNDGEILKKSLRDLRDIGENLMSVAVVPVGLTGHREGLTALRLNTKEEASRAIDVVEKFNAECGGYFAYCSDEMYMVAERELPDYTYYGSFDQIENGVGLIAQFLDEVEYGMEMAGDSDNKRKILVITGVSGEPTLLKAKALIEEKYKGVTLDVVKVVNTFFGESVTVTGLVTAGDIIKTLDGRDLSSYDKVFIPKVMLKEFDSVFLDNISLETLSKTLNKELTVVPVDGEAFVQNIIG